MSNRLTFSLASLIVLIAFGLVFTPTLAIADNGGTGAGNKHNPAGHDDQSDADTDENGHPDHKHPKPTISLASDQANVIGNTIKIATDDNTTTAINEEEFTLVVDFDMDVNDDASELMIDTTTTANLNDRADFQFNAQGLTTGISDVFDSATVTRVVGDGSKFNVVFNVHSNAIPIADDTNLDTVTIQIGVRANQQIYGLAVNLATPGQNNLRSDFLTLKLIPATGTFGNVAPAVISPTAPTTASTGSADVTYTVGDGNGDPVTVAATLDAASVAAGFTVGTPTQTSVTITQPMLTGTMRTVEARTVTLTLTPTDAPTDTTITPLTGTPVDVDVDFAAISNAAPTLTISTAAPSADVTESSFNVLYTTADADTADTVTVAAVISVSPSDAAASYSIPTSSASPVTITRADPTATAMITQAGTVTLTLTPSDALGAGTPVDIVVPFAEAKFVPTTPADLAASLVLHSVANNDRAVKVKLTWTASAGATGYEIIQSQTGKTDVTHTVTGGTTATFTTPVLAAGTYMFSIQAVGTHGKGASAPAVSIVVNPPPFFMADAKLSDKLGVVKDSKIQIWKGQPYSTTALPKARDTEGDPIEYTINGTKVSDTDAFSKALSLPDGFGLYHDDTEDRFIAVRSQDKGDTVAGDTSLYLYAYDPTSNPVVYSKPFAFSIVVKDPIEPTKPTAVTAQEEGFVADPTTRTVNTNQVTVTWTPPVDITTDMDHDPAIPFGDPVDGYIVKWYDKETGTLAGKTPRKNSDGKWHIPAKDASENPTTTYTTSVVLDSSGSIVQLSGGITPLGKYQFEVIAFNGVGDSDPSEQTDNSEAWVADPPGRPTDLRAALDDDDPKAVTLDWLYPRLGDDKIDNGGREIIAHVVYRTLNKVRLSDITADKDETHKLTSLTAGQYVFRVAAYNADGVGRESEGTEFVFTLPTDPTNVAPTFGDNTIAKISATAGTALAQILPPATDLDGDDNAITYSLGTTPALPGGVTFDAPTRLLSGTPTAAMSAKAYTYTATDSAGATASLSFVIEVMAAPANNAPTFGTASIASIPATKGMAITGVTLPAATDADGDSLTYSIQPDPMLIGLSFNKLTRYLSGTPNAAMAATPYTYVASDGKGGTAALNFTIEVKDTGAPPTTAPPTVVSPGAVRITGTYDAVNGVTTLSGMIPAKGFGVVMSDILPDLEYFFAVGGTITLNDGGTGAAKSAVISEILWGLDLGDPALTQAKRQFIELYNTNLTTATDVTGWKLMFKEGRPMPANDIDQVSNVAGAGWIVDIGQSGRLTGTTADGSGNLVPMNIVSMYRNINYNKVENAGDEKRLEGIPGGNGKGSWKASQRITTELGILASPGRKHFAGSQAVLTPTSVPRSPFIINEFRNSDSDWVELHNITDSEQPLKNYQLTVVTAKGTDTELFDFKDQDWKVPAKGYVVVASKHPRDTELAAGKDISVADDQEANTGAQHLFVVKSFSIPTGKLLFILRNAHDKQGSKDNIIDVIGTLKAEDPSISTSQWPLVATGAPNGNVIDGQADEDFKVNVVYRRANAGGGTGEKHLAVVGYTGVGYDRVAASIGVNGGTPGYENGAVKEKIADLSNADVTISEIMLERGSGRQNLPQWIELYNGSLTQAVNTNGWKLYIENATDVKTALNAVITLGSMTIAPNQTILIVTNTGRTSDPDHFPSHRVVNLWTTKAHRDALGTTARTEQVFSATGIYLELTDKDNKLVDAVGNLDGSRRTREEPAWVLPMSAEGDDHRSSLIRAYERGAAADGMTEKGWHLARNTNFAYETSHTFYGDADDFGTPGFRGGGPLPVSLSKFRPERLDDGSIVVRWVTESELNNAGFNILRSETKDGEYTQLNTNLIAGQGTTSERTTYTYSDTSAKPNVVYYYQIQDVSLDGKVNTLRVNRLKGHISPAGKATTTWGELKALQ